MKTSKLSTKVLVLLIVCLSSTLAVSAQGNAVESLSGFLQSYKDKNLVAFNVSNNKEVTKNCKKGTTLVGFLDKYRKRNTVAPKVLKSESGFGSTQECNSSKTLIGFLNNYKEKNNTIPKALKNNEGVGQTQDHSVYKNEISQLKDNF